MRVPHYLAAILSYEPFGMVSLIIGPFFNSEDQKRWLEDFIELFGGPYDLSIGSVIEPYVDEKAELAHRPSQMSPERCLRQLKDDIDPLIEPPDVLVIDEEFPAEEVNREYELLQEFVESQEDRARMGRYRK